MNMHQMFCMCFQLEVAGSFSSGSSTQYESVVAFLRGQKRTYEYQIMWNGRELDEHFNDDLLEKTDANYVVSRKTHGFEYTIRFEAAVEKNKQTTDVQSELNVEVQKLKFLIQGALAGAGNYQSNLEESKMKVTISVIGNIDLPARNISTYAQVVEFAIDVNGKINNDSVGNTGRPVMYTLVPIQEVRISRNKTGKSNVVRQIQESTVRRALEVLEEAGKFSEKLERLELQLRKFEDCIVTQTFTDVRDVLQKNEDQAGKLKAGIRQAIVEERMGNESSISNVLDSYEL